MIAVSSASVYRFFGWEEAGWLVLSSMSFVDRLKECGLDSVRLERRLSPGGSRLFIPTKAAT